jgi:hypothetical protein
LLARLNSTDFHAPLGGIERGGWKLAYETTPGGFLKDLEQVRRGTEMGYSILVSCYFVDRFTGQGHLSRK